MLALKTDGTLWTFGNEANFYAATGNTKLVVTPMQVGSDNDWQSISSATACLYHLLQKKDGSLWALDASDHRTIKPASAYKPITTHKINFEKDIAAFAAGGDNMGVVLTTDGEVWTWGRVLGEHSPNAFSEARKKRQSVEYKNIDEPWRVSVVE